MLTENTNTELGIFPASEFGCTSPRMDERVRKWRRRFAEQAIHDQVRILSRERSEYDGMFVESITWSDNDSKVQIRVDFPDVRLVDADDVPYTPDLRWHRKGAPWYF